MSLQTSSPTSRSLSARPPTHPTNSSHPRHALLLIITRTHTQVLVVFFFNVAGGAILNQRELIFNDPTSVPDILAASVSERGVWEGGGVKLVGLRWGVRLGA